MTDLDYGAIIKRSRDLVFQNKWLWVYGLVLAAFSGGGGHGGSSSSSSSSSISSPPKVPQQLPQNIPETTKHVLGVATNALKDWFYSVPPSTWLLLGLGLALLIIIGVVISWVITNWAKGSLIAGLADADSGRPVSLPSTSPRGLASLKSLVTYSLMVSGLIVGTLAIFGILFLLGFVVFSTSPVPKAIWLVITGIIGGLAFAISIVLVGFAGIYADRLIVLHEYKPWAAWKKSLVLAKNNFLSTIVMGLINSLVGCSVGCLSLIALALVLGIPAAVIIIPAFSGGFHLPSPPALVVLGLLLFIFAQVNLLVQAGLVVFRYSTWNLFVNEILKAEDKS